jgi:hypothetical protein
MLLVQLLAVSVFAQQDKLAGTWEGKIKSMQGEQATTVTFKKEGENYTGKMPGIRPGTEYQLKDVKIDGNKVTAKADVETQQGTLTINYTFTLDGENMNGQGALDFGGQPFTFDLALKRAGNANASSAPPAAPAQTNQPPANQTQGQTQGQSPPARPQQQQRGAPQPQQKQSIDYFVGEWSYKYVGRESALGPAPRDCTVSFTKRPDGKSVEGATACRHDGGAYKDTAVIVFDEATKMLTFSEKLGSGVALSSRGDWTSPISIRFTIEPVKVKGQTLQLRRTISVVSAHSFTIAEELSENGGPFVRLGNAVVSKAGAK